MKTRTEVSALIGAGALGLVHTAGTPEFIDGGSLIAPRGMMTEPPPPTHGKRKGGGS